MPIITKELILSVTYNTGRTSPEVLNAQLHAVAANAAGEGLLTGASDAEVETWNATVRDVSTSANPYVLTPDERDMIAALRACGFAVTLFNPSEMGKASARDIEARMVETGSEFIGFANAADDE
jgi:hypothetical protein